MNNCKSVYDEAKAKQKKENEESGTEYEEINMFGPLQFDALDEKSIDPKKQLDDFRKLLIVAFIAKRIDIQALSVDFVTERDLQLGRYDKPSLNLGNNLSDTMIKFQSSRIADKNAISQFTIEINRYIEKLSQNEKLKVDFEKKARKTFADLQKELTHGFVINDLKLFDEIVKEICGFDLIDKKAMSDDMYIIPDTNED